MAENGLCGFDHGICEGLLKCIKARDFEGVQTSITKMKPSSDVNRACSFPPHIQDPVCIAAEAEDDAIFNLLLLSGFDPDRFYTLDRTEGLVLLKPIHIAACRGNVHFCKRLIEKCNVSVDSTDNKGKTPLMWAVYRHQKQLVQYLVSQGADVNHTDSNGVTPLFLAVSKRHSIEMTKMLIDAGSDINVKVRSRCLFYKAAVVGRLDIAKLLYSHGHRLDSECAELWSRRDIKLIKFLIEINAPFGGPPNVEHTSVYTGSLIASSYELTHQWLDLLIGTGHFISLIDWDKVCDYIVDEQFEELKAKLRYHMCNPKSLQELCVLRIRIFLGVALPRIVDSLPLPLAMRKRVRHEHLYK